VLCIVAAPAAFPWLFGERWALAGDLVQILALVYFVRLVVSPLSYNYYIAGRNLEDLSIQFVNFVSTISIFGLAASTGLDLRSALTAYALAMLLIYAIYGVRSMCFARRSNRGVLTRRP
jgi:O-antigen/teichoic acid export membrane protein